MLRRLDRIVPETHRANVRIVDPSHHQDSQGREEAILDSINEGVFTVDPAWRVTSFNRAAERITGIPRSEALGRPCCEVFRADICETACALKRTLSSEEPVTQAMAHIFTDAGRRVPIRISHVTSEYAYGLAMREGAERQGLGDRLETEIPFPGLAAPGSQLAVPIPGARDPLGVLFVESPTEMRFTHADEDALVALATQVGGLFRLFLAELELGEEGQPTSAREPRPDGAPLRVRHYAANDSVFLGDDYLIKGVAGNILWTLLQDHQALGRTQFSNRELRADPRVRLPDQSDNLEARLVLLHRRLAERRACVQLEKTGRGRFRLLVARPLELEDMDPGA